MSRKSQEFELKLLPFPDDTDFLFYLLDGSKEKTEGKNSSGMDD